MLVTSIFSFSHNVFYSFHAHISLFFPYIALYNPSQPFSPLSKKNKFLKINEHQQMFPKFLKVKIINSPS